jgi:hypothetical protein
MPSKKKYLKEAAARARTAALKKRQASAPKSPKSTSKQNLTISSGTEPNPCPSTRLPFPSAEPEPPRVPSLILVDFDSESECGYQGGINHDDNNSHGDGTEDSDAGYETLSEFDNSDVEGTEKNGTAMRKNSYLQIQSHKPAKEWQKTEANRALGYNGHSSRTTRWQVMKARKRQKMHDIAKVS